MALTHLTHGLPAASVRPPAAPRLTTRAGSVGCPDEQPPLGGEDSLELAEARVAREVSTYLEREMVDLAQGTRARDLIHHAVKWRARLPRVAPRHTT